MHFGVNYFKNLLETTQFQGVEIGERFIKIKLIMIMKIMLIQMANNFLFR